MKKPKETPKPREIKAWVVPKPTPGAVVFPDNWYNPNISAEEADDLAAEFRMWAD